MAFTSRQKGGQSSFLGARTVKWGIKGEDATVSSHEPVAGLSGVGSHAHHRLVQRFAAHGSRERGIKRELIASPGWCLLASAPVNWSRNSPQSWGEPGFGWSPTRHFGFDRSHLRR